MPHIAPRVAVYAGPGASHSWVWLATLFERAGWNDVHFLDRQAFLSDDSLSRFDTVVFSGGAPRGMAGALGENGARVLENFIRSGRTYVGICAGACLPLHSSQAPLALFNWLDVPIANIDENPPKPHALPWKYTTPYGERFVFHPVREEVVLDYNGRSIAAPLYGGPPLLPGPDIDYKGLASFKEFTKRTLYLTEPAVGRRVVLGKSAGLSASMGKGRLVLLSPHLEHPRYHEANSLFLETLLSQAPLPRTSARPRVEIIEKDLDSLVLEIRRVISNARIRGRGLVPLAILWPIGQKIYEPEKALVFLEAIWERLPALRGRRFWAIDSEKRLYEILHKAENVENRLKAIALAVREEQDTTAIATETFDELRELSALFMNLFFRLRFDQSECRDR